MEHCPFAATAGSAAGIELVAIPGADHGYGSYSQQPATDAALHGALVDFFTQAVAREDASD